MLSYLGSTSTECRPCNQELLHWINERTTDTYITTKLPSCRCMLTVLLKPKAYTTDIIRSYT